MRYLLIYVCCKNFNTINRLVSKQTTHSPSPKRIRKESSYQDELTVKINSPKLAFLLKEQNNFEKVQVVKTFCNFGRPEPFIPDIQFTRKDKQKFLSKFYC